VPKPRHSRQSPPQDGFAVANLGQRPRITEIRKHSALKARFTSGRTESRFQRLAVQE